MTGSCIKPRSLILLACLPLTEQQEQSPTEGRSSTRSTQPCIPSVSLNRVPASAGVKAGMTPLPSGR